MFVTFEGPEGGGKSTAISSVASRLSADSHSVVSTREPGAGEFGKKIRAILLEGGDVPPRAELLLFLADRANHVETVIRPALAAGKIVLCDRYADSTLVYQGIVRGLDQEFVTAGNLFATGGLVPDLTVLFDIPPEIGLSRITKADRLDAEPIEFHRAVRAGFLRLAEEKRERYIKIDATRSALEVADQAFEAIASRLGSGL